LRTIDVQNTVSDTAVFDLDSLKYYLKNNINGTKDSMSMYIINKQLSYSMLTEYGTIFPSELAGNSVAVSYETTLSGSLGFSGLVSQAPRVVYFTQLWGQYEITPQTPISDVPDNIG